MAEVWRAYAVKKGIPYKPPVELAWFPVRSLHFTQFVVRSEFKPGPDGEHRSVRKRLSISGQSANTWQEAAQGRRSAGPRRG